MDGKSLRCMKRADLQKLAKKHGVKANMKNGDIIVALCAITDESSKAMIEGPCESEQQRDIEEKNEEVATKEVPEKLAKKTAKRGRPPKKGRNSKDDVKNMSSMSSGSQPSDTSFDLMSVKPPWDSTMSSSFNSTPGIPQGGPVISEEKETVEPNAETVNTQRTRSSSRNRTPNVVSTTKTSKKTFSVEKTRMISKIQPAKSTELSKNQRAVKRRSTNVTEVVQVKRSRRSSSANREDEKVEEKIDEDLQKQIMDEIRKKIDASERETGLKKPGGAVFASQIPRFRATGVQIGTNKPITPGNKDWNKLHSRQFENMESIDDYERRKKERAERLLGSNQKGMASVSRLAKPVKRSGPKILKPVQGMGRPKPSFMSPAGRRVTRPVIKTPRSIIKPGTGSTTNRNSSAKVFVPTVTSTSKINLDFAARAAKVASPKRVTIVRIEPNPKKPQTKKTPAMPSKGTPGNSNTSHIKRTSTATPFHADRTAPATPASTKKAVFDLKASLKKPLSWVPHKGPLRQINDGPKKLGFQERMKDAKKPNITSREKRRQKLAVEKKDAKDKRMMLRRGIK